MEWEAREKASPLAGFISLHSNAPYQMHCPGAAAGGATAVSWTIQPKGQAPTGLLCMPGNADVLVIVPDKF